MNSPRVSVIIPVRNGGDLLRVQLSALRQQGRALDVEILVADNGSTDESVREALAHCHDNRIKLVDASEEKGPSHARNAGAQAASGNLLLFCDADDRVCPGWIEAMVQALAEADVVGGVAIETRINSPRVQRWYRSEYASEGEDLPEIFSRFRVAATNNMGARADVFRSLGGFDQALVNSGEDLDFCMRAFLMGYEIRFASGAEVGYRLRDRVKPFLTQRFNYGKGWADIYFKHEAEIPYRHGRRRELRLWQRIGADLPQALLSRDLVRWLGRVALNLGRLQGSLHREGIAAP